MQAIQAPIKPGQSGPEVVNLQDALFALLERDIIWPLNAPDRPTPEALVKLTEGLKQERVESLFGAATGQFVMDFQIQQGLGDHLRDVGVEEKTADKLNEWLKRLGLLDIPEPEGFVVRGTVLSADGKPIRGALVSAFDRDMRKEQELGVATTDDQGKYLIRYGAERFAAGDVTSAIAPKLIVRAFAGEEQIGNDVVRPKPARDEVVDFKVSAPVLSEWEKVSAGVIPLLKGQGEGDQTLPPWEINDSDINFIAEETGLEREHIRLWALAFTVGRNALEMQPAAPISTTGPMTHIPVTGTTGDLSAFAIFYGWFRQGLPTEWEALQTGPISTLRKALLDAIDQNIIPRTLREDIERILAQVPNPQIKELENLLGATHLSPDKMRAVLAQADGVEAISDELLAQWVEQKTLAEDEAQIVGLNVSLHRLAGGEQSLVSTMLNAEFPTVKTGKLQQARDLALLESEDWERVLKESGAPVPEGLVRAEYARSLAMEAVGAFPHAAFVQRATRVPTGIDGMLNKIQPLLEKNKGAILVDFETLDLAGVNETDREAFREAHTSLKRMANSHPGLGLHEVFSQQNSVGNSVELVNERMGWLRTVFELNPEVSFLGLDYLPDSVDLKEVKFGTLSEEARGRVLADLKAHQRIYSVANNPIPALEIMQAGFHSASAIALARASDFAEKTDLVEAEARAYHAEALGVANAAALQWNKLNDIARDKFTTPIRMIPSPADFFMPLKGFAELINDQPWCECEHCQSVLSPAAYFVDLMYYIEQNILKDSFKNGREKHPLHLQVRRPDLWELELTCKNTNEYVPYLDVVNEVLERYLRETISRPVGTTLNVYKHLAEQDGSFKQPFTLPIERLEILLGHFGLTRYDVAKTMGSGRAIQVRARLKISQKDYDLITTERTSTSTDDLDFFKQLFKIDVPNNIASVNTVLAPMEMETFLHATGLSHEIVEAVLKTKFVNVDGSSNPEIEVVLGKLKETDVQNNSELVKHITLRRLDRIHRFARLWRKLPWTVEELDYVLTRLASQSLANGIDISAIEKIVDLLDRNAAWSLPIDELMALSDVFPPKGLRDQTSLFDRLFNQPPFLVRDGRWLTHVVLGVPPTSITFSHPAWKKRGNPVGAPGISDPNNNTLTRLLAGLQVVDKELVGLIESLAAIPDIRYQSASTTTDESILLTKESIGILYRHARLMRLLKSPVTDFVKLINLTPRIKARLLAERYIRDLGDVTSVVEFAAWQRASGFSLNEIIYATGGSRPEGTLDPSALASEIVTRVKAEKSLEFADTVFTQIGLTDLQSREIVLANLNPNATDINAFEALPNGTSYRLKMGFDPETPLLIDPSSNPPVDGKLVINLLREYHPIHVLDVALGGVLNLSREQTTELRKLAYGLSAADAKEIALAIERGDGESRLRALTGRLVAADTKAISLAMQGGPDKARLTDLISDTLRYQQLFKSEVFKVKSLRYVRSNRAVFFGPPSNPPNNGITRQVVRNVAAYVALAKSIDTGLATASDPTDIDALHEVLKDVSIAADKSLAKVLRTDETRIGALKPHLIPLPSNPFEALALLARCLVFTEQMGVSGETLKLMKSDAFDDLSRAAEDVFGAFRAKYPEEKTFQEKMEPFEDKLRSRKRDGLVDFIISKWPEPFADANKLYEYFLIDVLMEGCGRTSRVVSAISSLQLYVHRVLMNLERSSDFTEILTPLGLKTITGVTAKFADPDKRHEWYWRKHYRVWEANRKVFLYPENYIEPELRDDKTPLFKEIEDTLLQQEISDSNVNDAYAKYLTGFDEVAHLKIAGAYYDPGAYTDRRNDELHLFGVTQDSPPIYYYRNIKKTQSTAPRISAWQKLTLQIPAQKVSPIVFEGRLYVFWMETTTRALSTFKGGSSSFGGYRHAVRIKYSTLRADGAWTPPQSLRFSRGEAVEESRLVDDPQTGLEAVKANEEAIERREKELKEKEATATKDRKAAEDAAGVLVRASKNAADALRLANNPLFWASEPIESLKTLGEAILWATQNDKLLTGYKDWAAFMAEWKFKDPRNAALFLTVPPPMLHALMAKDATMLIEITAATAVITTDTAKRTAEGAVTSAKGNLDKLLNAPELRVSVRWDKSQRSHRESLDNYKPEGWEWDRVYPDVYSPLKEPKAKSIRLMLVPRNDFIPSTGVLDLPSDEIDLTARVLHQIPSENLIDVEGLISSKQPNEPILLSKVLKNQSSAGRRFYFASLSLNHSYYAGGLVAGVALAPKNSDLQVVNGETASIIIESQGYPVWMRKLGASPYKGTKLGTTLTATLTKEFGRRGASTLLEAGFQKRLTELPPKISPVDGQSDLEMKNPFHPTNPYLTYFRETFFHIPFLIANHLNSQQKFAETQRWYHYIFNPAAADGVAWQYREFRNLENQSLRKMLTLDDALDAYREDPFNPHAIARTRLSAYQKSIVMKYIDNLLDWGDSLFNQFTMESINEATMLYVMAQDILGPRPPILGSCGEGKVFSENNKKTYNTIRPGLGVASDFLIELESPAPLLGYEPIKLEGKGGKRVISSKRTSRMQASTMSSGSALSSAPSMAMAGINPSTSQSSGGKYQTGAQYWTNTGGTDLKELYGSGSGVGNGGLKILGTDTGAPRIPGNKTGNIDFGNPNSDMGGGKFGTRDGDKVIPFDKIPPIDVTYGRRDYFDIEHPLGVIIPDKELPPKTFNPVEVVPPKYAVFCIPANKDLLAYWGRVEDRLFKVRNCMDIAGVRRKLELFAPEIDPRLLVRMKAAGLTLDDVMNATSGNLPPYRFTYLIEKARQYAGTLQSFGSQLLSAIEKRDGEELAQLRAVHEQNLLKMRARMMQLEIDATEDSIESLRRQKTAAEYRQGYFRSLSDVGLLASESKQQQLQREASNFRTAASLAQFVAGILSIIPDAGAFTAMKFGGSQLGAAGRSVAEGMNAIAAFNEMGASMAGMESSNLRRDQDWKHQEETAKREISQIEKQIAAAEIRRDIAVHSLEVHDKTVDQAEELFDFFGTKFSSFGRYTFLSTQLHKLYRQSFNAALSMAKMTEQAYRAERTDDITLLDGNYWDAGNAGLLAGERLLLDLQQLERRFIETNYRTLEVEQAFSLMQFDPDALLEFRKTGECLFDIPEIFFDLTYPGHYRRRIKAVRLTVPCVTGPYTNVGATLQLNESSLRKEPKLETTAIEKVPLRHTATIAASNAQNDAGVFEFSFRDERYMPFEGAGAISKWRLRLPKAFRSFDYQTISDVIMRISYTAVEDEGLRAKVQDLAERATQAINNILTNDGILRVFSLRHDFPDAWARLVGDVTPPVVSFELGKRHFPYFMASDEFALAKTDFSVSLNIATADKPLPSITLDGTALVWSGSEPKATVPNTDVMQIHKMQITNPGGFSPAPDSPHPNFLLDESKLKDIYVHVTLKRAVLSPPGPN